MLEYVKVIQKYSLSTVQSLEMPIFCVKRKTWVYRVFHNCWNKAAAS